MGVRKWHTWLSTYIIKKKDYSRILVQVPTPHLLRLHFMSTELVLQMSFTPSLPSPLLSISVLFN